MANGAAAGVGMVVMPVVGSDGASVSPNPENPLSMPKKLAGVGGLDALA